MYVATVNGYRISTMEYQAELERIKECMHLQQASAELKQRALEQLIDASLLLNKASESDITVENDDIDNCVVDFMLQFDSEEEFHTMLQNNHVTLKDLRTKIRNELLIKAYIKEQFPPKDAISADQLQEMYLENKEAFITQEKVRASHILIKGNTPVSYAKAMKIRADIHSVEDFQRHASTCSDCPSGCNCGDLGFFPRGKMVKAFDDVVFNMKINEISNPIQTEFGCHIIMVTDKQPSKVASFDEVKDALKNRLEQIDSELQLIRFLKKLRATASIEILEENL